MFGTTECLVIIPYKILHEYDNASSFDGLLKMDSIA